MKKKTETLLFDYIIRRSQRAKKTRIVVTPEKIEVVAPLLVSKRKIHAFVKSQQNWIASAREKVEASKQVKKLAPTIYKDGVEVPYRGKQTQLTFHLCPTKKIKIEFNKQKINIFVPAEIAEQDRSEFVRLSLISWMKNQAKTEVMRFIELHAKKYHLYPRFIRIKTQKSRWGSCGIHNDINLNWLLILAPPQVMEYVVVHELCHIKERNHSQKFWHLVKLHLPDFQIQRNWLKKEGRCLMLGL